VVGAASSIMSSVAVDAATANQAVQELLSSSMSFGTELPNMLFRVGFVGGLMGAARHTMTTTTTTTADQHCAGMDDPVLSMRERAETLLQAAYGAAYGYDNNDNNPEKSNTSNINSTAGNPQDPATDATTTLPISADLETHQQQQTPNPYEHLQSLQQHPRKVVENAKLPSGCVGAYSRAVARASEEVTRLVKERRRSKFLSLSAEEQRLVGHAFLDACGSDDSLAMVTDMIRVRETIDVDAFYLGGPDATESCALHTSAFHGSLQILDFLCRGIDESDSARDGGLCNVNAKDDNGWTALHFAAGANSVEAIRILAGHGADLSIEAVNGYTSLQWAVRLQNKEAAEVLRSIGRERETLTGGSWMARTKPLSMIASRFFALIPSH
jgi:hypothetical protein